MFPLQETNRDEHGQSYVVFRCNDCNTETNVDYKQYELKRSGSGTCPFCGMRFWGQMIVKCPDCGQKIPRVEHRSWGTRQDGSDDIFFPAWTDGVFCDGYFYTPEEYEERERYDNMMHEQYMRKPTLSKKEQVMRWWEFWKK